MIMPLIGLIQFFSRYWAAASRETNSPIRIRYQVMPSISLVVRVAVNFFLQGRHLGHRVPNDLNAAT